ncbi:hypothetical protein FQN60_018714 [Etheostoma spectabile]|uniref:Uncharacterized protein n=1 Tax=Etheostoma spectabile TaxID=54343 RepID=A0A5J5CAC2_9PERO|nr:hypothetical protein FQN60_018714 [Etheostoma spectabile]
MGLLFKEEEVEQVVVNISQIKNTNPKHQ